MERLSGTGSGEAIAAEDRSGSLLADGRVVHAKERARAMEILKDRPAPGGDAASLRQDRHQAQAYKCTSLSHLVGCADQRVDYFLLISVLGAELLACYGKDSQDRDGDAHQHHIETACDSTTPAVSSTLKPHRLSVYVQIVSSELCACSPSSVGSARLHSRYHLFIAMTCLRQCFQFHSP